MFSLCLKMISTDSMATGIVYIGLINQVKTGASSTVTIAPSEEYPQMNTTTAQVAISEPASAGPIGNMATIGSMSTSFDFNNKEVYGSCAVTHENVHYIFGGSTENEQISGLL